MIIFKPFCVLLVSLMTPVRSLLIGGLNTLKAGRARNLVRFVGYNDVSVNLVSPLGGIGRQPVLLLGVNISFIKGFLASVHHCQYSS